MTAEEEDRMKKIVQFMTKNMERESRLLYPDPQVVMNDPYGLLDLISGFGISEEKMDAWMVEAQP